MHSFCTNSCREQCLFTSLNRHTYKATLTLFCKLYPWLYLMFTATKFLCGSTYIHAGYSPWLSRPFLVFLSVLLLASWNCSHTEVKWGKALNNLLAQHYLRSNSQGSYQSWNSSSLILWHWNWFLVVGSLCYRRTSTLSTLKKWTTVGFNLKSANADRINFYKTCVTWTYLFVPSPPLLLLHTCTITELELHLATFSSFILNFTYKRWTTHQRPSCAFIIHSNSHLFNSSPLTLLKYLWNFKEQS